MNRYALFLGCTTSTQVVQYELSARWVCHHLGIDLFDIGDFLCCGINQINLSHEAGLLLAAANLAYAEQASLDILTLCAACTGALSEAVETLRDEETRDRVNRKLESIGLEYRGKTRVKHISRVLVEDIGIDKIKNRVRRDFSKIRAAPHYGCHTLKPESAFDGFDDPDNPQSLHQLISATGAVPVPYETLNLCCGGKSFPVSHEPAFFLIQNKLDNLMNKNIDCLVVQCQTCYLMYSDQQLAINKRFEKQYKIPVLLYPQLLGMALGGDPKKDLALDLNAIPLDDLLEKADIRSKL